MTKIVPAVLASSDSGVQAPSVVFDPTKNFARNQNTSAWTNTLKDTVKSSDPQGLIKTDPVLQYLTNDTTYQQQLAAINKALSDYQAQEKNSIDQNTAQYNLNTHDLSDEQGQATDANNEDFAARGMYRSGGFVKSASTLANQYASRQSGLDLGKSQYETNQANDLTNFTNSETLASQQARQDALNRRTLALLGGTSG